MKMKYICQNCQKEYESKKPNSKFCSMTCRRDFYHYTYFCDNCGKEFAVEKNKIDKLREGVHKHLFCSVECKNEFLIKERTLKICKNCGKEFEVLPSQIGYNFCCMECYQDYRAKNARIIIPRVCPQCGEIFYSESKDQIYCSLECSSKSQQKRVLCVCEFCGIEFERIISEVEKTEHHFCSKECKQNWQKWSVEDNDILISTYNKIPLDDIQKLLSKQYNTKAIKSQAGRLGLYNSEKWWTPEEEDIVLTYYTEFPSEEVLELLPGRTKTGLIGKARQLGLKSYRYISSRYTEDELEFIKNNYLELTDEEIGFLLDRTAYSITQRIYLLGLHRPKEIHNYGTINNYVRAKLFDWKVRVREENDHTCSVTNERCRGEIIVHHCRSFNLLMIQALEDLNFTVKATIDDYTQEELDELVDYFLFLQEYYGEYCCVKKDIHVLFHRLYGFGDNTIEQWDEFVEN